MAFESRTITVKQTGDRNDTRKRVIEIFWDENPGLGKGSLASRYRYNVETLTDGRCVYLVRPAWLKAGFDFVIHLEGTIFLNGRDNPAHRDIENDLIAKAHEKPELYHLLHEALCRVYDCEDPDEVLPDYQNLTFDSGLPVQAILKVVKWFFIEQDIRYWNYSGRGMFKSGVIDAIYRSLPDQ